MIDIALLNMLVVTAVSVIFLRDLFAVVMVFGIYSLLSAGFFLNLAAPDVALTEAAIGAGIAPMLMLGTLALTRRGIKPSARKSVNGVWIPAMVVLITGAGLIYGTTDMPYYGDPLAAAHQHVAPRYIRQSGLEIGVPNIVTSILASYRGYDTLGEVFVIFTAGIGVLALLGSSTAGLGRPYGQLSQTAVMSQHVILRVITKILIPFILLYAFYTQFHGDYGPGGGFQAGVIFAAGFILYAMIYGLETVYRIISPRMLNFMMVAGVLLYAGTGVASLCLGGNYLDYNALAHDPVHGQHLGIFLVELGVGICVASVMMSIFFNFTGRGAVPPESEPGL